MCRLTIIFAASTVVPAPFGCDGGFMYTGNLFDYDDTWHGRLREGWMGKRIG